MRVDAATVAVGEGDGGELTALEILGVSSREAVISRLFGALIRRGGAAGHRLLAALVGREIESAARLQVRLEQPFDGLDGDPRQADLVVSWHEKQRACVLVVAHTLFTVESASQLDDYAACGAQFARWALDAAPHATDDAADVSTVLLTLLDDRQLPAGLRVVRHTALAAVLRTFAATDALGRLAHEWAALVERFDSGSALQWDGTLGDTFADAPAGLDARHVRFEHFAGDVAARAGAEMHGVHRGSAQGRAWFGAALTWPGLYSPESPRRGVPVDLRRDWWLALQIRLHLSPAPIELSLSLYCETLPYVTRSQFAKLRIAEPARVGYRSTRARLGEQLKLWKRDGVQPWDGWRPNGEWCQLATFERRWNADEALALIAEQLAQQVAAVQPALQQLAQQLRG